MTLSEVLEEVGKAVGEEDLLSRKVAEELDRRDELARFRSQFLFPSRKDIQESGEDERPSIYLCGNSLGLQPAKAKVYVEEELDKWNHVGVEGHFSGKRPWLTIDECVHENMAKVVGAEPSEVAVMNSLTVNLHLLLISFYRPTDTRFKIIIEKGAFPSDLYVVNSQAEHHGRNPAEAVVQLTPREGEVYLRTEDVISKIRELGDSLAVILLGGVQYYSGQFFDIPAITKAAQDVGAYAGWDLAHAVGNLPLKLHDWGVDFACWCTYKYLNSGPGSIGGAFVHDKHAGPSAKPLPRLAGWWGHDLKTRFEMDEPVFLPIPGAFGWRLSNPAVLPVVCLQASLELFIEAGGMDRLRQKSLLLTGYLEWLLQKQLRLGSAESPITVVTPSDPNQRGCQLSVKFSSGEQTKKVSEGLKRHGIVCDVRKPDVIRVAPTPLYNSFLDVWEFVTVLQSLLSSS